MKMPGRPWYPPMKPRPDIFGLHPITFIGLASETPTQRAQREAKVEAGVTVAFAAANRHLGEDRARALFAKVLRRRKRGPGRALAPDRDFHLLRAYDQAAEGESIAAIARRLRKEGRELGHTEGAIAAQIRKLVAARKERDYRARVDARRWRMALRNEPPTLLEMALSGSRQREK
jgi:hypothetical protein